MANLREGAILETHARIRAFVLAGNARFTVKNPQTGNRFTYRVRKHPRSDVWFVSVLTGANNESDYRYAGIIDERGQFRITAKSINGMSTQAFAWLWWRTQADLKIAPVEVWHEGRCGRCGRALTVPESIASGIGPVCEGMS